MEQNNLMREYAKKHFEMIIQDKDQDRLIIDHDQNIYDK